MVADDAPRKTRQDRVKVTQHAKYVMFQLTEVAVTPKLFAAILYRIERLALLPPVVNGRVLA